MLALIRQVRASAVRCGRRPLPSWLLPLLITGAAAALRLIALDTLPPGLYRDEAYNGLDALRVLGGDTPLFFEANNGREPLFIYLLAASVALWGRSPGALRIVAAFVGTLTVPATYWLGRTLYNRRVGVLAAWLAVTMVWTLNLSRVAFRAVTLPPLIAVMWALLWPALRARRPGRMALAGAVWGLTFYTYLAARFTVVALLLFVGYVALWQRRLWWARGWMLFALAALIVFAPLGGYFLRHWEHTLARAGQVSIFNPAIHGGDLVGTLLRHAGRTLRGFFVRGDAIPRHNVPLRPVFDPLVATAFVGGVCLALHRARADARGGLLLIWVGTMLLPTVLAEDAPHMLRAVGVLPVLLLLPAWGLDELSALFARWNRPRAGVVLLGAILALSAMSHIAAYVRHVRSETAYYHFETGATQLAVDVNRFLGRGWQGRGLSAASRLAQHAQGARQVFIAPRLWRDWAAVRFLVGTQDNGRQPPDTGPAVARLVTALPAVEDLATPDELLFVLWPFEDHSEALARLPHNRLITAREGARERGDLEAESRLLYITLHIQVPNRAPANLNVAWERDIRLVGYRLEPVDAHTLAVHLYWQAGAPIAEAYTVFCHVVNREGALIGQHDGPAAGGYYGTERWRPGDIVEDIHVVSLIAPYDPQTMDVVVGLYAWATMAHLRLVDQAGQPMDQTRLTLR